jgi:hypothetical protein
MDTMERLGTLVDTWHGANWLHDPQTQLTEESECSATLQSILSSLFFRFDYRWFYQGAPQEGSLLIGCERKQKKSTPIGSTLGIWERSSCCLKETTARTAT